MLRKGRLGYRSPQKETSKTASVEAVLFFKDSMEKEP